MKKAKEFLIKNFNLDEDTVSFFAHSKNYLTANFIVKALGLISIPIFTRLLVPSDYGVLAIFSSLVSILVICLNLGVREGIYRRFFEEKKDFAEFLGSNLVFLIGAGFFVISLSFFFSNVLSPFFKISPQLVSLAVVVSVLMIIINVYTSLLQAKKLSKKYSKIIVSKAVLLLVIAVPWVYFLQRERYMGNIYATLIVAAVFSLYSLYNLIKCARFRLKISHLKYALFFGLPLLPNALSKFMLTFFDRIIIGQLKTMAEVGLYSIAYNIGMISAIAIMSTSASWSPFFYKYMNRGHFERIESLAKKYSKLMFLMTLLLILFSKEIAMLLAAKQYYGAFDIIPVVIFSYVFLFLYTIYVGYSLYRKKTWLVSINTVIAVAFNIALNYLLIPSFGYKIAAYTTLFSYILLFLLQYFSVKYIQGEKVVRLTCLLPGLFGLISLTGIYFIMEKLVENYFVLLLGKILLLFVFSVILFKKVRDKLSSFKNV
jgi:O-antigen/teichoic acid export membrane protein